jgi:hypothetical protein
MKAMDVDASVLARRAKIVAALRSIVSSKGVIEQKTGRRPYESDALTAYRALPMVVVLPDNVAQVRAVLAYCHENNVKMVPRGMAWMPRAGKPHGFVAGPGIQELIAARDERLLRRCGARARDGARFGGFEPETLRALSRRRPRASGEARRRPGASAVGARDLLHRGSQTESCAHPNPPIRRTQETSPASSKSRGILGQTNRRGPN